jgi:hypothetical protein
MWDFFTGNQLLVMTFVVSIVAAVVGYLLAWWCNRTGSPRMVSFMVAGVAGLAGLFVSVWLIRDVMSTPPYYRRELWEPLLGFLIYSPLPLGGFYLCAKFILQARRSESTNHF